MLLSSLELENIRSYRRARIAFPKGRSLLSGDIGAGKSTVLFAIEFALFGLIRGWNDGEKLLRHGSSNARVRLEADIEGPVIIERSLKRTASGIQQEEVRITEQGVERVVTPSEARAFIVARLGYPSEFVTKQPVLFRYTVFTAQESMKQIIEERPEARLAAIRTIFGIDRYESITRNALIVARSLKQTSATFAGRLERKSAVIEELTNLRRDAKACTDERARSQAQLEETNAALARSAQALERARAILESEREKRAEHERRLAERSQLESELESLIAERAQLSIAPIHALPDLTALDERLTKAEERIADLDRSIEEERERRTLIEKRSATAQAEREGFRARIEELRSHEVERTRIEGELAAERERFSRFDPQAVRTELAKLESSMIEIRDARARLDERIRSERERIATMPEGICPTCAQPVDTEHRADAIGTLEESVSSALLEQERIAEKLERLEKSHGELSARLNAFVELDERVRAIPSDRSEELEATIVRRSALETSIASLEAQRASIDERIESLLDERTGGSGEREALRKKIRHAQHLHLEAERARRAIERAEAIDERLRLVRERIGALMTAVPAFDPQSAERFEAARTAHSAAQADQLEAARALERADERLRSVRTRTQRLEEELIALRALEQRRQAIDEVIGFLSDAVPDLSSRIESAIMRRILIETNDQFSRWFSILVDDLEGYLDERFTPRIVQSGYDVSFENLSGGERTSVALAFRLALHESINHLTGRSSMGLLILDEPTEGFSSEQLDAVRSVLLQLRSEQVIIVSHEPVVEGFVDHVIRIEKRGDESVSH